VDLIFPHHEAEIAQMESISGKKPLVKYWLHTAFLNLNKTKMSKSLGNIITIKDVLKKYDGKVLRYFFLSNHYRTPINFSYDNLEQSKNALDRLNDSVRNLNLPELSLVISKGFFGNDSKLFNLGNAFLINDLSATMYFRYIYS
ncbi:MAG: class I tRNA ligase family protein, partial [Candidatus Dadabacteria bacterium]|nr:class I tRNA ligase family protein [Candidatus Dadabacteria bacterium]